MKQQGPQDSSRRRFLRGAAVTAVLSPALGAWKAQEPAAESASEEISLLGQISIARQLYQHDEILHGSIRFLRMPHSPIRIEWIDGFGRVCGSSLIPAPGTLATPLPFSFDLRTGLTYMNSIRVTIGSAVQAVSSKFMRSPAPQLWNDYQVISWANYPDGYYDQLRRAGINATIAFREGDFSNVLDNSFNFYVEQMAWDVYAIYHKDQAFWRDTIAKVRSDRANLDHWVRKPCLNDPATQKYVSERIQRYTSQHKSFRPLYYCIADELGQGDQISANDFCHSTHCTHAFAEYLRKAYGSLQGLQGEWALPEVIHWDDESVQADSDWQRSRLMIAHTTTDLAFESIALVNLQNKYGSMERFNKEWGTSFPVPRGPMSPNETWGPVVGAARESLSILNLNEANLEKALGPLDQFNVRSGNRAGWNAPNSPTKFKNWTEVRQFLLRYYKELGEVQSTKGWNAAPWSDFRNFMDSSFADAVLRASAVCKAEDPFARCATEGGQAPFAFGWYNYEQVLRAVDVIEPYNIGSNVEVIRSLKPETIMLSTVGFDHKPGTPMTPADRLRQHQAVRPVWWELFHSHQGTIIWDNHEETGTFVDLKTGKPTVAAETFQDVFHELRGGLGMLVMNLKRQQAGIAIHYSHSSVQAHWLLENVAKARDWMVDTVDAYVTSRFVGVRNSWTKIIEDLQLQYDFVSASQIETGALNSGKYKIFILPESIALSAAEAEQIREFVRHGGTVVADSRTALLNEHCRDLGTPQLNDLFGISETEAQLQSGNAKAAASEGSLNLAAIDLATLMPANAALAATTGNPLAKSGEVPMVVVNRLGSGRAIYLNLDISGYAFDRLNPKASSALPDLLDGILQLAEIRPEIRVLGVDGKRLPGTEVVVFENGACRQVAIFRNPQLDDGGWASYREKKSNWRDWTTDADNSAFEKEESITIEWGAALNTYDVRAGKDIGAVTVTKTSLSPWEPLIFTRSPLPLPKIELSMPSTCTAGSEIVLTFSSTGSQPEGTVHVIRMQLKRPSGEPYELYAQNQIVASLPHIVKIPTAFNDPLGKWSVEAVDLISGQSIQSFITVTSPGKAANVA